MAAQTGGEKRVAKTLAERLADGDPEAFAALYDRLALRLFNTARTMTDSLPDAEDTVRLPGGLPYDTAIPRHRDTLHVLDTRDFLQGDL